MAIRLNVCSLSSIAREPSLRYDINYLFCDALFPTGEYYTFSELFEIVIDDGVNIDDLKQFYYVEIGDISSTEDVSPVSLNIDERDELNENYFKKIEKGDIIKARKGDILISKVRPYLKKMVLIDENNEDYYYTNAFIHVRPKVETKLLFYALKSVYNEQLNAIARQGKGYPTLNEKDLAQLKFPKHSIDSLIGNTALLSRICDIEMQIAASKQKRKTEVEIINDAFLSSFHWDVSSFYNKTNTRRYSIEFSAFSDNYDLRFSPKFHRPAGRFVLNDLQKSECLRVKNFLSEPITLGASVSPSDFDPNGDCYYISMATVKNSKVELDDSQLLSKEYVSIPKNSAKSVRKGDIIMTRSGAAIGKFAMVNEDINAIHADFTMRIRLKNVDKLFAYYYFRSLYFQYLIEVNYKGLQNNNIFPNQVQELPFPNASKEKQASIVNTIKAEMQYQEELQNEIQTKRNSIDALIKEAI